MLHKTINFDNGFYHGTLKQIFRFFQIRRNINIYQDYFIDDIICAIKEITMFNITYIHNVLIRRKYRAMT